MSENHRLLVATDWSRTPLGERARWPATMERLVDTIMNSGFPICTAWGDEGIQIYNDGYNAIYGDKHPKSFGTPLAESWQEIHSFLGPAFEQVRQTKTPLVFKDMLLPLVKHDRAKEYYFDFSYSPICDEDGRTLGIMSVATETTETCIYRRHQDSCALNPDTMERAGFDGVASELRERLAQNSMDAQAAALFQIDPRTRRAGDLIWQLQASPAQLQAMRDALAGTEGRTVQPVEPGVPPETAPTCAGRAVVVPLFGDSGQPLAALVLVRHVLVDEADHLSLARSLGDRLRGIISPVQALDRVRRQMAEQDHLYRFLFENIGEPAIYAQTEGRSDSGEWVLAANPAACRLLGYAVDELVGMSRDQLVDLADPKLQMALEERENERVYVGELGFRHKDGRVMLVEISSRLVRTEGGELRSVNLLRDISARLAREAERERLNRHETIARLTGGFAHDFNNLLAVIMGSLELAREAMPTDEPAQGHLATAQLCADRGAALTGQLLSYARLQPLQLRPVDINEQLQTIRDLLISTAGGNNTVSIHTAPELPPCRCDEAHLTTAIINLVANARDAMPGGGRIDLRTDVVTIPDGEDTSASTLPAGNYVRLSVRDHGPGIDPAIRERIFEPYVSSKDPAKRSGLGLAMVQGLVRQCGGDVLVQDMAGEGARFDLLFPEVPVATTAPAVHPPAQEERTVAPLRILLVEDHADVRTILCEMLASAGHQVEVAESGRSALDELREPGRFDLLLTDLVMPGGISGFSLAQEARRREPGLAVLLITGHDPWGVTRTSEGLAFELVTKPITRTRLLEAVQRALAAAGK